jgi:hypothetical protein
MAAGLPNYFFALFCTLLHFKALCPMAYAFSSIDLELSGRHHGAMRNLSIAEVRFLWDVGGQPGMRRYRVALPFYLIGLRRLALRISGNGQT